MKVMLGYNEHFNCHYYADFDIVEEVPKVGTVLFGYTMEDDGDAFVVDKVEELTADIDNRDEVWNYNLYKVVVRHYHDYGDEIEENDENYYYAIEKNTEGEE